MTVSTVWLVTSGEYSDYCVLCVAPNAEIAEDLRTRLHGDDTREIEFLSDPGDYINVISYQAYANVDLDGQILHTYGYGPQINVPRGVAAEQESRHVRVTVLASSADVAQKAVREYAAELGAELSAGVPAERAVSGFNARHVREAENS